MDGSLCRNLLSVHHVALHMCLQAVIKALETLAEEGKVKEKTYGKQKVYVADQVRGCLRGTNFSTSRCPDNYRAQHWHWPNGLTHVLKLSGQFGPPVCKFYRPNRLLTRHCQRFPHSVTPLFIEKWDNPNTFVYFIFQPTFVLLLSKMQLCMI